MMPGPAPMDRRQRLQFAREIAGRAREVYGPDLIAAGLYGSMARGEDGPYSDVEMFCVLRRPGEEFSHEWSYGPGKAEVDFYGEDVLLRRAAEVDGRWPLTHGAYYAVLPLHDPGGFFPRLRGVAAGREDSQFHAAIEGVLVGELYEFAGKLRNAMSSGSTAYLPELAVQMARYGAFLVGLHNRRLFSTGGRVLEEALTLPERPQGLDDLCQMVMSGNLSDTKLIATACERFWTGVAAWAATHGYAITDTRRIPF